MEYQLNKFGDGIILTNESGRFCIPFDPANTDYQAFLKYQAEGGAVLPADDNEQTA